MKNISALFLAMSFVGLATAQTTNYEKAISYGQSFRSRNQFLEKGLKSQKVQFSSSFAADGMSKYVTFFTDYDAVAAASAQAKQELREFTTADANKMSLTGLVFAYVEIHARGMIPTSKLPRRWGSTAAHLVLEVDGKIVQPLSKSVESVSDASIAVPVSFYSYWRTGNFSFLTGGPLDVEGAKAVLEFVFAVDPAIKTKRGRVILVDADGHRHDETVDFAKLLQ